MIFRRKRRTVPGLNTTSTADISFMLLIFFLVTTSMEVDMGMARQLPPDNHESMDKMDIDREKVITFHLMGQGKVVVDEKDEYTIPLTKEKAETMRRMLKEFIVKTGKTHIVEVQTDGDADYDAYFALQEQIVRSYRELRDAAARHRYGMVFDKCSEEMRGNISRMYPQRITEVASVGKEKK